MTTFLFLDSRRSYNIDQRTILTTGHHILGQHVQLHSRVLQSKLELIDLELWSLVLVQLCSFDHAILPLIILTIKLKGVTKIHGDYKDLIQS